MRQASRTLLVESPRDDRESSLSRHDDGTETTLCEFEARPKMPRMLVIFRQNPDYHVALTRAAVELSKYFSVHIVCSNIGAPGFSWPAGIKIERVGLPVSFGSRRLWSRLASIIDYFIFAWFVFSRIRSLSPDLVYAHDSEAFVAAGIVRRWLPFPLVYENHDQLEPESCSRLSLRRWVEKKAFERGPSASLVVYPAKERADYYQKRSGDPRKPLVWPYYASKKLVSLPSDCDRLMRARFARRELLYTGVINSDVASDEALRALDLLGDNYHLTVYGAIRSEDLLHFQTYAQSLTLGDRIFHGGWINLAEMVERTINGAVGLVLFKPNSLNYRSMGTSTNKLYEYAARGIPVIVPDGPSFREALENEDWVFFADVSDPASIANGVRFFLEDLDRYLTAGKAARTAFEERFNFEAVFSRLLERLMPLIHAESINSPSEKVNLNLKLASDEDQLDGYGCLASAKARWRSAGRTNE